MSILLVAHRPEPLKLTLPGAEVVSARTYLGDPRFASRSNLRVFNLCRSYRYQSLGYYVSLLAEARGHNPLPSVATMQELKNPGLVRTLSEDLDKCIQNSLAPIGSDKFELSVYFGSNLAARHSRLARELFALFPTPLLRAGFRRREGAWELISVRAISLGEVPEPHMDFLRQAGEKFFRRPRVRRQSPSPAARFDLAMLVNDQEATPPSDERALRQFAGAAEELGIHLERIQADDLAYLAAFDGLFIRETTSVNHPTWRMASRAQALGLEVVDKPHDILRCSNKIFLAEILKKNQIAAPRTLILSSENLDSASTLGFPQVLKTPDSAFSAGVEKAGDEAELQHVAEKMLSQSDLIIAQEFLPTAFDWRVGVFDGKPLYVCRYYMAKDHWQIMNWKKRRAGRHGHTEAVPLDLAPAGLLQTAVAAASLLGDGLYGIDLKEVNGRFLVIEINDNPNIDSGVEDQACGDQLYLQVMGTFLKRLKARVDGGPL